MTTVSATPPTMQNSQSGKYAPSTPMDGELAHADTRPAAIAAIPIARFGHLPLASGICRFKVVPAVGINVTPCSHANVFCLKFRGFGQRGETGSGAPFLYQSVWMHLFQVVARAPLAERL